jgi:hypothetical protein
MDFSEFEYCFGDSLWISQLILLIFIDFYNKKQIRTKNTRLIFRNEFK